MIKPDNQEPEVIGLYQMFLDYEAEVKKNPVLFPHSQVVAVFVEKTCEDLKVQPIQVVMWMFLGSHAVVSNFGNHAKR